MIAVKVELMQRYGHLRHSILCGLIICCEIGGNTKRSQILDVVFVVVVGCLCCAFLLVVLEKQVIYKLRARKSR